MVKIERVLILIFPEWKMARPGNVFYTPCFDHLVSLHSPYWYGLLRLPSWRLVFVIRWPVVTLRLTSLTGRLVNSTYRKWNNCPLPLNKTDKLITTITKKSLLMRIVICSFGKLDNNDCLPIVNVGVSLEISVPKLVIFCKSVDVNLLWFN